MSDALTADYYARDVAICAADYERECERFNEEELARQRARKTAVRDAMLAALAKLRTWASDSAAAQ